MRTLIFTGLTVLAVILWAKTLREKEETMNSETDVMLLEILSECMEAYCEDCEQVLAQGTHPYHDKVASVAYNHSEIYDHMVHMRSWADL